MPDGAKRVRVLMFGRLSDAAGWRERVFEAESLSALRMQIAGGQPDLGRALEAGAVAVAVNGVVTRADMPLGEGDEIGFLPPMSGG